MFLTDRLTERLGTGAPVEDLVHDAIERVLRSRSRGRGTPEAKARRIADRLAEEYESRRARWPSGRLVRFPKAETERQLSVPDAQASYERRVTRECLTGAFGQLPIDVRRLLTMHDIDDIPLAEIAREFGCSATSAKIRLQRARMRLSEVCLAACDGDVAPDGTLLCLPREGGVLASAGRAAVEPRRRPSRRRPKRR